LRVEFRGRPDVNTLRALRRRVDDPAFASAVREYYHRLHNDPSVRIEFLAALQDLLRTAQDHKSDLNYAASQIGAIGIGGGVGLIGGSIVAVATAAFPIVAVIPILGGAVMAGTAFFGGRCSAESLRSSNTFVELSNGLR
jgi:hypothetical protein